MAKKSTPKPETNELEQFDPLKAEITTLVAPTLQIVVVDAVTSQSAIDVARQVKGYMTEVEKKRKELVGPLNDRVKQINTYVKEILAPLERADGHIRTQLNAYAAEQEKIRQAELARIQKEREEAERKAREEQERIEAEILAKQAAQADAIQEAADFFGADEGEEFERQAAEAEALQQRELEAARERAEKERIARLVEHNQKTYDASLDQVKNTRRVWKCRAINIDLVPKEFLKIEINEKAILEAKKAGVDVPGIEYWQEVSVAIGATTYMPKVRGRISG